MSRLLAIANSVGSSITALMRGVAVTVTYGLSFVCHAVVRMFSPIALVISRIAGAAPFLIRLLVGASKIGLATTPIGILVFFLVAAVTNPYMKADLEYSHERSSATEIFDHDRRWIGIIPPANFSDWSDGSILPPDHAAIPVGEIPASWRVCIAFLEDRDFDGVSRWFGIHPLAILKSGWQTIIGERRRGASTLYMQVVRTLNGRTPGADEAPGEVLLRKAAELFGATALVRMFDENDSDAAARFVAMHLPLVIGASQSSFGEPLHGIELASRILFGTSIESLPIEKQALLAAAVKAPILLAPPNDSAGGKHSLVRWKRVRERADYCLRKAFLNGDSEIAAARERLAGLDLPKPTIDPALANLLPKDPQSAWKITVNPIRRALYFARYELSAALPELEAKAGKDWRGRIKSIQLTTSTADNLSFARSVLDALRQLQATTPGLELSLVPNGTDQGMQAEVVVACTDSDGRVKRIYSSRRDIFWNRRAPVGSVAKMVAAVALGRVDHAEAQYCPAPIPGVASSDTGPADVCLHREKWLSARQAFARSNNKAIHWALHRLSRQALLDVAATFGLPNFGDTPPATALTIGTFELTPAEMLRLAAGVGAGLADSSFEVRNAHLVESITSIDPQGRSATLPVNGENQIQGSALRRMFTPQVKAFVARVLGATSEDGGTLYSLHGLKGELGGRLYAKTGTVSVLGSTRDIHIVGTFMRNEKPWSFVVTIGASSNARPLGTHLVASRFARVAALAICGAKTTRVQVARN